MAWGRPSVCQATPAVRAARAGIGVSSRTENLMRQSTGIYWNPLTFPIPLINGRMCLRSQALSLSESRIKIYNAVLH